MDFMQGLLTRRSVRKYQNRPIARETIEKIIKAAQHSPSAHNHQPWEFYVIKDGHLLLKMPLV